MQSEAAVEFTAGPVHRNPQRPLLVRWGKKARKHLNRFLSRYSLVPLDPVLSTEDFPWLRQLEAAAPAIRNEAERLLTCVDAIPPMNEMSPDHQRVAGDGGWRSFFLVGYGYRVEENCARCPETTAALSHVPGLVTALFSILEPGSHVGKHSGVSKGILIAHLGLNVPQNSDACRMDVDGHEIHWAEGETFVFDDTFPHEVWNDTSEFRVILLIQFRRPMRLIGRLATALLVWVVKLSPYIQDARKTLPQWERQFKAFESVSASPVARASETGT